MENKTIHKIFNAKVKDLGEGKLEAIVSTNDVDRHGEIVDIEGIDITNYEKNPVVMWAHDYSLPPIARTLSLTKEKIGKKTVLKTVMEFATGISELAREVYNLYREGFMNAFSIGFIPLDEEGNTYTKTELLEYSAVPIPANPNALLLAKAKGIDIDILDCYIKGMKNIKTILEKEVGDLTLKEVEILKANSSELTDEQKEKFAEVLVEKDEGGDILAKMDEKLNTFADKLKKELDPVEVKDIKGSDKEVNKTIVDTKDYSKEELFKMYVVGLSQGDLTKYKSAMNTTDDSALLPPEEFVAEVERLEEELGVARKFANVRRTTKSTLSFLLGDDDLEVFDTDEAGVKQSTSISYEKISLLWRKFAGILPITDELEEESAIDLWNDAVNRFARAFSKKEDELVFTETSAVSPKNKGILSVSGTNVVTLIGDSFEDLTYDDIVDMVWGVPTQSSKNGRFWLNKDMLAVIQKIKDSEKRPIWQRAMADGTPSTILGKPYELVDVLPGIADDAPETAFMAFGDLKYVTLGERTGMSIQIFDSGIVGDPDEVTQGNDLNLITQDMKAMRAVKRMNAKVRFPAAFSVAKTAASAS
ncbi:MAG: phage major capsid protein [Candidatus Dojkabacteria bacterium]